MAGEPERPSTPSCPLCPFPPCERIVSLPFILSQIISTEDNKTFKKRNDEMIKNN